MTQTRKSRKKFKRTKTWEYAIRTGHGASIGGNVRAKTKTEARAKVVKHLTVKFNSDLSRRLDWKPKKK